MTWFTQHTPSPQEQAELEALEALDVSAGYLRSAKMMAARVTRGGLIKHNSGLSVRTADINRAKPFVWAWEKRIIVEYVNLLIGEEGIGKGNLVAWIVAKVTKGALPGDLHGLPRKVVIIGDEDSWYNVWVPRLLVAGADLDRVQYIAGKDGAAFDVQDHIDELHAYIKAEKPKLIYIDQLLDNLGVANSHHEKEVRNALAPLRALAQASKVAILATMHPNKREGTFRNRIAGTPAFNALSRSSLLLGPHPDDPGRKAVVLGKGNYTEEPEAFEFRIAAKDIRLTKPKRIIEASFVTDTRTTSLTRDQLLDSMDDQTRRHKDSKADLARRLLRELFADGKERSAGDVQNKLHMEHELSPREVTRARKELGLATRKRGFQGESYWRAKEAD